jgi:hypothetical protein
MTLPSDSLPKRQVKVPAGENERKDYKSELFPEVYSRHNPEEDRLLYLKVEDRPLPDERGDPDLTGLDPRKSEEETAFQYSGHQAKDNASSHMSVTIPFKTSWLANRIDFEELGSQRARNRLRGALIYMWKLSHRVHKKGHFNKEGCCFCMTFSRSRHRKGNAAVNTKSSVPRGRGQRRHKEASSELHKERRSVVLPLPPGEGGTHRGQGCRLASVLRRGRYQESPADCPHQVPAFQSSFGTCPRQGHEPCRR